jgi:hypothetical protein
MKKKFTHQEVETFVTIVALGCLSVICVFLKYDWKQITEALMKVWR